MDETPDTVAWDIALRFRSKADALDYFEKIDLPYECEFASLEQVVCPDGGREFRIQARVTTVLFKTR